MTRKDQSKDNQHAALCEMIKFGETKSSSANNNSHPPQGTNANLLIGKTRMDCIKSSPFNKDGANGTKD